MADRRGAAGARRRVGEQREPVVEPTQDLRHGEHPRPRRRQLDSQGQAVQARADLAIRGPQVCRDEAWIGRDISRAKFLAQMRKYPILLCPTAAIPAFRHGQRSWTIEGKTVNYLDAWRYAEWFNLLGNPAAVVPVSQSLEGLPIGVQIVAAPWREDIALAVAARLEREFGGWKSPPEVPPNSLPRSPR